LHPDGLERKPALRAAPAHTVQYERRRPEQTLLHRLVREHLETFLAQVQARTGTGLLEFVRDEFEGFLECGILAHGFLRVRCVDCAHEKLVAFSCKRCGFCPSCGARRMAQSAAVLVDEVIPQVPVRQWVLSFPIGLRILFAAHPELLTPVLRIVHRVIAGFLLKQAGQKRATADTGAVTLIQRFGSAANLNIHLHCLVLDGVYRRTGGEPVFQEARAPTGKELQGLLEKIIVRLMKKLTRLGYLVEEEGMSYLAELDPDNPLTPLQAASCTYRIALGPRAGQRVLSLRTVLGRDKTATAGLCADAHGFSLHAGVRCGTHQRKDLERLCRYITRPAIANERLKEDAAGNVVLQLKSPWRDGTTHLRMTPLEFMQRLAALVPRPRLHLTRFHGVLAPNAVLRAAVVPGPAQDTSVPSNEHAHGAPARMGWARLLKRVFDLDLEHCPQCGGAFRIIAAIEAPAVIVKILTHLGLPARAPPRAPARRPEFFQAA
jgi:hypothetical protein